MFSRPLTKNDLRLDLGLRAPWLPGRCTPSGTCLQRIVHNLCGFRTGRTCLQRIGSKATAYLREKNGGRHRFPAKRGQLERVFKDFDMKAKAITCSLPSCVPYSLDSGRHLSSEYGTYKTVKARFWPELSGESPQPFVVVSSSLGSGT